MYRHDGSGQSAAPPLVALHLLDQVHEQVRHTLRAVSAATDV